MVVIAHRCGPTRYPEQTIASAQLAMEQGADMVEIDVRLTIDGHLAVSHDESLQRVYGADRNVATMTADEFKKLSHVEAPGFNAYMLSDFIVAGFPLLIHVKSNDVLPQLLESIAPIRDRVVLGLPDPEAVCFVRERCPGIPILSFAKRSRVLEMLSVGVDYIRLWEEWLEPGIVAIIKASGSGIWVMSGRMTESTVGIPTDAALAEIMEYQPDGILINDVTRV